MSGLQAGVVLAGRYRLVAVIGRGGMGVVWRAVDEQLHRDVAVKTLPAAAARTPDTEERFRREALAVARLNQRRVAGLYDYVQEDGVSFIVMELLGGESLAERITRDGILPAGEAAEIVAQAAEGLQAAHDAGITHRDIKPANIMLTTHGVKLLDFGLAATAWDAGLTSTGMMVGTLAYLSPERAAGEPGTEAGDIYALGVVLYECLAGHPPFQGDNPVALVHAQAAGPPELPASTPPWLAAVCWRALAAHPADRFPSATEFAAAVRGHAPATRHFDTTDVMRPAAPSRRRLGYRPALLGVLAVVALVAVILVWPRGGEPAGTGQQAGTTATAGAPKDKPKRTAVAAAVRAFHDDLTDLTKSGDVRPEAAKNITEAVKETRKQLAKKNADDATEALGTLGNRIDDHAHDGTVTPKAADTLHTDVRDIAGAAGLTP
ncbi:MAG TPA: serine/threonine-protein kinase [Actinophytocola sp.]|nr:serine/threonine-protein kinase [Actinophytocola sp.]